MSRSQSQHCGLPTHGQRYLDSIRPLSYARYQGAPASSSQPYPTQEPPRFLYPDSQGYDPTIASTPYGSRPPCGEYQQSGAEPRYTTSGSGSLAQYGTQGASPLSFQQRAPGSTEYYSLPSPSNSAFGYGRGSVGSSGWSNDVDSQYSSSSLAFPSPVRSDESVTSYAGSSKPTTKRHYQQQEQQEQQEKRPSDCSTIMGLDKILHNSPVSRPPRRPPSRYHLHIRQHPLAARACGAGDRDRRPVDPPPIVQMLLSGFSPSRQSDIDILQDPRFTVGCHLFAEIPASYRKRDRIPNPGNEDDKESPPGTPLLSGKAFVSPFFVDGDPDPNTAPAHPSSSSSFPNEEDHIPDVRLPPPLQSGKRPDCKPDTKIPATFFIFSDLSIRTAGLYRLQFRLTNWGHVEDTGQSMPILAEAWTEPFRVYPAKDFPGMRDSSPLAEGLKELGFVELKTRGKGKGKGRRR